MMAINTANIQVPYVKSPRMVCHFIGTAMAFLLFQGCGSLNRQNQSTQSGVAVEIEERYVWRDSPADEFSKLVKSNKNIETIYFEDRLLVDAQVSSVRKTGSVTLVEFRLSGVNFSSSDRITNRPITLEDYYNSFPFRPGHVVELSFAEGDKLAAVYLSTYEVGPKIIKTASSRSRLSHSARKIRSTNAHR